MATSIMKNSNDTNNVEQGYSQPIRRGNGRKKAKNMEQKKKNKEPQRGMGVEKLERMRIQEILKNPVLNNNSSFVSDPNQFNAFQYSKFGGFPNGQMGLFGVIPGSSGVTSFGSKSCVTGMSNEAFSNKSCGFKCQSEYCTPTSCKKKKRYDGGNMGIGAYKVKQDVNMKMCSGVGDSGFLGLSVVGDDQNNIFFNQQNLSPGFKTHQVGYATRPGQPGAEVLAVHKKGLSNQENGNLVMEYEFFPAGCNKDSRNDDESVMMDHQNQNMVAEAASTLELDDEQITTCLGIGVSGSAGFDASIDLSLKLSY